MPSQTNSTHRRHYPKTEARLSANRANARKSTGPRTAEGKAISAQNAVTHGLLAKYALFKTDPAETPEAYNAFHDGIRASLKPGTPLEDALVERITFYQWRLSRAWRFEMMCVEHRCRCCETPLAALGIELSGEPRNPSVAVMPNVPDTERLVRYESMIGRELNRAMAQLAHLRQGHYDPKEPSDSCPPLIKDAPGEVPEEQPSDPAPQSSADPTPTPNSSLATHDSSLPQPPATPSPSLKPQASSQSPAPNEPIPPTHPSPQPSPSQPLTPTVAFQNTPAPTSARCKPSATAYDYGTWRSYTGLTEARHETVRGTAYRFGIRRRHPSR